MTILSCNRRFPKNMNWMTKASSIEIIKKSDICRLTLLIEKTFIECVLRLPSVQASSPPAMAFFVASLRGMITGQDADVYEFTNQ